MLGHLPRCYYIFSQNECFAATSEHFVEKLQVANKCNALVGCASVAIAEKFWNDLSEIKLLN